MSCRELLQKTSAMPIYISTIEVMLSSSRVTPPLASKPAAWDSSFQRMPPADVLTDLAGCFPARLSSLETLPRKGSPPRSVSSEVYSSRLDIVLARTKERKGSGKDNGRADPSGIRSACPTFPRAPKGNRYCSVSAQSPLASCKQCLGKDWSAHCSSTDRVGPMQFAVPLPSASASRALPCWTSRLDVALCALPGVSQSKKLSTVLAPSNSELAHGYSQCKAKLSDLHASVKLHISTCSVAIKPFQATSQARGQVYSSLLLPQRKRISPPSSEFAAESEMTRQAIPSGSSSDLQITRFHVTSTAKCPGLPLQTVSREIWLSPVTASKGNKPVGKRTATNAHLDPDMVDFQSCHSSGTELGRNPSSGIIPMRHKISKITLILATPWTSFPIQVVREFRKSPSPSIFIKTQGSDTGRPTFHPDGIRSGFSLSINPVCRPEFLPSPQHCGNSESKPFPEPDSVRNAGQDTLVASVQPRATNATSCRTGDSVWCPSISVRIASFGPGRKVVKISIPF